MEIIIKGNEKEITAFVVDLHKRFKSSELSVVASVIGRQDVLRDNEGFSDNSECKSPYN